MRAYVRGTLITRLRTTHERPGRELRASGFGVRAYAGFRVLGFRVLGFRV